jgi:hypothetical protein
VLSLVSNLAVPVLYCGLRKRKRKSAARRCCCRGTTSPKKIHGIIRVIKTWSVLGASPRLAGSRPRACQRVPGGLGPIRLFNWIRWSHSRPLRPLSLSNPTRVLDHHPPTAPCERRASTGVVGAPPPLARTHGAAPTTLRSTLVSSRRWRRQPAAAASQSPTPSAAHFPLRPTFSRSLQTLA